MPKNLTGERQLSSSELLVSLGVSHFYGFRVVRLGGQCLGAEGHQ